MRKLLVTSLSLILVLAAPSAATASSEVVGRSDPPTVSIARPSNTGAIAPHTAVGTQACSNVHTGISIDPLSYSSWSTVGQLPACSSLTVKVYGIGNSNSVLVRIVGALGNELSPRVLWDPSQSGYTYTWAVGVGSYQVQASAYYCCNSTYAMFDVWTT